MLKKLSVIAVLGAIFAFSAFSEDFFTEPFVRNFYNKGGNYVVVKTKKNTVYYPRHAISQILCVSNGLSLFYLDTGGDYEELLMSISEGDISNDENSNLVITVKKAK